MSSHSGRIELVLGPMFSGKTSELFRRVKQHVMAGEPCLVLKYARDTRYSQLASSHDGSTMTAVPVSSPWDVPAETLARARVIAIDEAQFMRDVTRFCDDMANGGKVVIVAALDSTWERAPFDIVALVPLAERVDKLSSICLSCHGSASFSRRIDTSVHCTEDIGGADKYVASCRACLALPISRDHLKRNRDNAERVKLLQSQ